MAKKSGVYVLSQPCNKPEELCFMEKDMIKYEIKYGIVEVEGKYVLVRETPGYFSATPIEFEKWYKPFKRRGSLEERA